MAEFDHNKIIKQAGNSILKPDGLFQKGSSRTWIDDNGWFLTVVEFQPSAWGKGSYLNVAIHFLWDEKDYLSFDYSVDPGSRVQNFVAFDGDEVKFFAQMQELARIALEKVKQYRRFRDLAFACTMILENCSGHEIHRVYQNMMICGLCRDPRTVAYFNELLEILRQTDIAWARTYYIELTERITPIVGDPQAMYAYILKKISTYRRNLRAKSMKKLRDSYSV